MPGAPGTRAAAHEPPARCRHVRAGALVPLSRPCRPRAGGQRPLIALFNGGDRWHAPVRGWLQANPGATLIRTWCAATEVCALLARRSHNDAALDFLRWCQRGGLTPDRAVEGSLTEVLRISERFASQPFDLADASIAEAAARLEIKHLLSIDAGFDVYRNRAGRPLVNLLQA